MILGYILVGIRSGQDIEITMYIFKVKLYKK